MAAPKIVTHTTIRHRRDGNRPSGNNSIKNTPRVGFANPIHVENHATDCQDHSLVYPNQTGKPMNGANLYNRNWKRLLERAGLPHSFTFHTLLYTFATTLLRQNVNPKIVQEALDHATITQTMDTYSHVMPDMQDMATKALEQAFTSTTYL